MFVVRSDQRHQHRHEACTVGCGQWRHHALLGTQHAGHLRIEQRAAFKPITGSPEAIPCNAEANSKVYEELVKQANISLE